jgi:hypothetical protein
MARYLFSYEACRTCDQNFWFVLWHSVALFKVSLHGSWHHFCLALAMHRTYIISAWKIHFTYILTYSTGEAGVQVRR